MKRRHAWLFVREIFTTFLLTLQVATRISYAVALAGLGLRWLGSEALRSF